MNPSHAGVIALSLSIAPAATAASSLVAPVMTVNAATITKDPLFSDPINHPSITSESTTDPQGFTVRREHASAWLQKSESYTFTTLDLSPEVAGTVQELEFRWSLQHEVDGGTEPTWRSWNRVVEAGAEISESVTLTAVPEGATLGWAPLALALACRRRRSSANSAGR